MDDLEHKSDKIISENSAYMVCINFFDALDKIKPFQDQLFISSDNIPKFIYVLDSKLYALYDTWIYNGSVQKIVSFMAARASLVSNSICDCQLIEFEDGKYQILGYLMCLFQNATRKKAGPVANNLAIHEVTKKIKNYNTLSDEGKYGYFVARGKRWSMQIDFSKADQQIEMLFGAQ